MVGEYISAEGGGLEGALRSLANNAGCGDLGGESHHDGLGFSGALWAARTSAADGSKVDASLYKTMRSYAGSTTPGYEELFKLFVAGLAEDAPEAAARLDDELLARGFAPQCTRIREQRRGVAIEGPEELGGFYAPGTLYVGARVAPGVIQVHYKFSPGATLIVNVGGLFSQGSFFGDGEFKPRLVARYGQPISWMSDGRVRGVFDEEHKLFPDDSDARIILEVPADATDVYVQIVNHGEADGVYQTVLIEESGGTSSSSSGGASSGGSSSERPEYIDVYDDEGCGCHQAPSTGNGLLAAIAAFGIGLARRRRRAR